MVTTRSASSKAPRVIWASGGIRVNHDAVANNSSQSRNAVPPITRRTTKKQKRELTSNANMASQRITRSQKKPVKSTRVSKIAVNSRQKVGRVKSTSETVTKSTTKKSAPRDAPPRRSARLAEQPTTLNAALISHDRVLPSGLAGSSHGRPGSISASGVLPTDDANTSASPHVVQDTALPTVNGDPSEPTPMAQEEVIDENTIPSYNKSTKKITNVRKDKSKAGSGRPYKETARSDAPNRRSARLAQRACDPNTVSSQNGQQVPPRPTADVDDASEGSSRSTASVTNHEDLISPEQNIQIDTSAADNEGAARSAPIVQESPSNEYTMDDYMDEVVDVECEAAERRQLLMCAIKAPFRFRALSRALYTQVVRAHLAILAGHIANLEEAINIPLDHPFWTDEVAMNPYVSVNG